MSSKVYEIAMQLKGKLEGSFLKSASQAIKSVNKLNSSFNSIAEQKVALDKAMAQSQATKKAFYAYNEAKAKVQALEKELKGAKGNHQALRVELNQAVNTMNKAQKAYSAGKTKLAELKAEANATGKSFKDLEAQSNALNKRLQAKAKIEAMAQQAQSLSDKSSDLQMKGLGNIAKATAATAAVFGMPIKAAMDIEDQTAELRKYTEISEEVMAKNKELATQMAVSTAEMVSLQANAMQSNILDANDLGQVETYTKTAAKAMIALDMTGEQVGASFAAIKNKIAGNMDDTIKAFDLVNSIANSTAASGDEVLSVLERSGGMVAASTKLNTSQIVALSGAFRAASVSAEVAATAQSSFINSLMVGSNATKTQLEGYEKLGIDPQKMAKALNAGGAEAQYVIEEVFRRISKLSDSEKNAVVGQVFGNEAGLKTAILTMANKAELLTTPFEIAAKEINYLGSMQAEYEARAATTSNSLQTLKNTTNILGASIGSVFLPALNESLTSVVKFSKPVLNWIDNNKDLVKTIGTVSFFLFGIVGAMGATQLAFGMMLKPIILLMNVFVMLRKAMFLLNLTMLANPIFLIIAAIVALIAIGYALYKNWDSIKLKLIELWQEFQEKFPAISAIVSKAFTAIGKYIDYCEIILSNLIDFVVNIFTGKWDAAWQNIKNIFKTIFDSLKGIAEGPINYVTDKVSQVKGAFSSAVDSVKGFFGMSKGDAQVNVLAQGSNASVPALASGGIVSKPTMALIGEGGESEAVMPLSKLSTLLQSNASHANSASSITVHFAPNITINGGDNVKAQVNEALAVGQINLKKELEQLLNSRSRLSY